MITASSSASMACKDSVNLDDVYNLNIIPDAIQTVSIQRDVVTTSAKISELRLELEELEDRLRRHQLALSSPVRQIPPEILGEIFVHTLSTYPILDYLGRHQLVQVELVCRTWRNAARSNHGLWSGLYVDDSVGDGLNLKPIMDWFSRSGKGGKSLVFESTRVDCKVGAVKCKTMARDLGKLLAAGLNITHFEYYSSGPLCFQNFVDTIRALEPASGGSQAAWDSVKTMHLQFQNRWDIDMPNPGSADAVFKWLPSNLTSLKLYLPCDNRYPTLLEIPTRISRRLTSFDLFCEWGEAFILDLMYWEWDNLERLTLFIWDAITHDLDECIPAVLPKVRSLRLRGFNPSDSDFLQMLTTPRLVDLDIGFEGHKQFTKHGFADNILSFLDRSKCKETLRSLTIRYVNVQVDELIKLLTDLPLLTHLTLAHVTSSEDAVGFFAALQGPGAMPTGSQLFLPRLKSLELIHFPLDEFPGLFDYIKSRHFFCVENGQVVHSSPLRNLVVRYTTLKDGDKGADEDEDDDDDDEDEDEDEDEDDDDDDDEEEEEVDHSSVQVKHILGGSLEGSEMVKELRERCGVFVDVAPYEKNCYLE